MFASRRKAPAPDEMVMTSGAVLDVGLRVTRVFRSQGGSWIMTSATEDDDAQPLYAHFSHIVRRDSSLVTLKLRPGEYALRTHRGNDWSIYGPVSDEEYDRRWESGVIDAQQLSLDGSSAS
jgi:hypothetical protein